MRRTQEDAEQTRQDLLAAAERVFGRQGFAATKLSEIAKEANVTRGAIYHHFGNKMELFVALHKDRVDPYFQMLDEILASDLLPKDKIKKLLKEFLNRVNKDSNFLTRQRFDIFRDVEFCGTEEIHEFAKERAKKIYHKFVDLIYYGQEINNIRQDIQPELSAFNLMAYLKGLVSFFIMEGEMAILKKQSEELIENALKGF